MSGRAALAVCQKCGLPVRVTFDSSGEIKDVFAVCGHVDAIAQEDDK